mmetsp:Transcript_11960/g.33669  ORF Transcript_11960/g.33669 Transcript_11960/m.33669 type:complete len:412 (+) Transcript_11960:3863-5098(+)
MHADGNVESSLPVYVPDHPLPVVEIRALEPHLVGVLLLPIRRIPQGLIVTQPRHHALHAPVGVVIHAVTRHLVVGRALHLERQHILVGTVVAVRDAGTLLYRGRNLRLVDHNVPPLRHRILRPAHRELADLAHEALYEVGRDARREAVRVHPPRRENPVHGLDQVGHGLLAVLPVRVRQQVLVGEDVHQVGQTTRLDEVIRPRSVQQEVPHRLQQVQQAVHALPGRRRVEAHLKAQVVALLRQRLECLEHCLVRRQCHQKVPRLPLHCRDLHEAEQILKEVRRQHVARARSRRRGRGHRAGGPAIRVGLWGGLLPRARRRLDLPARLEISLARRKVVGRVVRGHGRRQVGILVILRGLLVPARRRQVETRPVDLLRVARAVILGHYRCQQAEAATNFLRVLLALRAAGGGG